MYDTDTQQDAFHKDSTEVLLVRPRRYGKLSVKETMAAANPRKHKLHVSCEPPHVQD
jgi:hypothetical protein